jgi:hypothetical protein
MNNELIAAIGMGAIAIGLGAHEMWKSYKPILLARRNRENALAEPPELVELTKQVRDQMRKLGIKTPLDPDLS